MSLVDKIPYKIIFLVFIIVTIAFIIVIYPNANTKIAGHHIIAHAGGAIQGHNYTNSLEAVENSIKKGIKFIELDFSITSDGQLVCAHDWETYAAQVGGGKNDSKIPCYYEFENSRLFSKYTPMTIRLIDSVLIANPGLYLVTDVISDFDIINSNLGKFKNRMLVECFSYEDYVLFENAGYYLPMYSFAPDNLLLLRQRMYKYRKAPNFIIPNMFVVEKQIIDKQYAGWNPIMWLENTSYAVYTAKNRDEANRMFLSNDQIRFIYVDNVE